jgi:hypothetical protein
MKKAMFVMGGDSVNPVDKNALHINEKDGP